MTKANSIAVPPLAYLFQAVIILLWWVGILESDYFYSLFEFPGLTKELFICFLLPDFIIIALLSLWVQYNNFKGLPYIILGGFAYAAIYCISVTLYLGGGYLSSVLMSLATAYNVFLCYHQSLFKTSSSHTSIGATLAKTGLQILLAWSLALVILPYFILELEDIPLDRPLDQKGLLAIGSLLFLTFSFLGLRSAYVMGTVGRGTPLPMDAAQKLVVKGPYKIIRNPMAVGGLGQGLSIAFLYQSPALLAFFSLGILLWHYIIRPIEEKELESRFGQEYLHYKARVNLWWPKNKSRP